jgi:hypothetical protein
MDREQLRDGSPKVAESAGCVSGSDSCSGWRPQGHASGATRVRGGTPHFVAWSLKVVAFGPGAARQAEGA